MKNESFQNIFNMTFYEYYDAVQILLQYYICIMFEFIAIFDTYIKSKQEFLGLKNVLKHYIFGHVVIRKILSAELYFHKLL